MKTGLSLSKEAMGAFIDAVYAIAVTILALELPNAIDSDVELLEFGAVLINYAISFCILFALWVQHRRINQHISTSSPAVLWVNAAILMLVCLIPHATSLVFKYGGDVNFSAMEHSVLNFQWTLSVLIDVSFVAIVVAADIGLLMLLHLMPREARATEAADIYRSKITISILLIMVMATSLLLPIQNRFFLLALPAFLIFEHRIAALVVRLGKRHKAA